MANKAPHARSEMEAVSRNAVSLDTVNDDCLMLIMKNLPARDLNSFAPCNHYYREARRDPSLDHTRTGTIVLSNDCTPISD